MNTTIRAAAVAAVAGWWLGRAAGYTQGHQHGYRAGTVVGHLRGGAEASALMSTRGGKR